MAFTKAGLREFHTATHESLDVLLTHMKQMPEEALARELDGFGHSTVRAQIAHVCTTELSWIRALQGLSAERIAADAVPAVSDMVQAKERAVSATRAYLDALPEDRLNQLLERYPDDWSGPKRSPAFIVLHVVTHAFHHKGQIVAMLRLLGHPAPDTDLQRL